MWGVSTENLKESIREKYDREADDVWVETSDEGGMRSKARFTFTYGAGTRLSDEQIKLNLTDICEKRPNTLGGTTVVSVSISEKREPAIARGM